MVEKLVSVVVVILLVMVLMMVERMKQDEMREVISIDISDVCKEMTNVFPHTTLSTHLTTKTPVCSIYGCSSVVL